MVAICVLPPVSLFTKVLFLSPVSTMITDNVNDGEDGMNPAEWVCAILNNCGSLSKVANEEIERKYYVACESVKKIDALNKKVFKIYLCCIPTSNSFSFLHRLKTFGYGGARERILSGTRTTAKP